MIQGILCQSVISVQGSVVVSERTCVQCQRPAPSDVSLGMETKVGATLFHNNNGFSRVEQCFNDRVGCRWVLYSLSVQFHDCEF